MNSSTLSFLTGLFPIQGVSASFFLLQLCFVEFSELNANSVDTDQTPDFAASDLGLHCLSMSLLLNGLNDTRTL